MLKSQCMFLCLCFFAVSCYGANLVPFIDKCVWNDKACLVASTSKAIPYFAKGLPELGIPPMDPLKMSKVTLIAGDLQIDFTSMDVTGTSKAKVLNVERDIKKNLLKVVVDCPIDVVGHYEAQGKLFFLPIEGSGPFHVNCKNIRMEVDVDLTYTVGPDGVKYWNINKATHNYDVQEKAIIKFENLFNGDMTKAQPIMTILNENWKEIMHSLAKPIVDKIIDKIVEDIQIFYSKVPADQLEI